MTRRGRRPSRQHAAPSRRVLAIIHGERASQADIRKAIKAVRATGIEVLVRVTFEKGDIHRIVAKVVRWRQEHPNDPAAIDTIMAGGGDGTLNEVVSAMLDSNAPADMSVAILPVGTSNDFAAVAGIPADLSQAIRLAADSSRMWLIDVGTVNGQVFMNTSTLGATSELGHQTSPDLKRVLGPAAYLVSGLRQMRGYNPTRARLKYPTDAHTGPGGRHKHRMVRVTEELLHLTVGNSRQMASILQPCPHALLDDGLLDVLYLRGRPQEFAASLASELLREGLANAEPTDHLQTLRVPWIEVEASEPMSANLDGELLEGHTNKFRFEVLRRRVLCHLPNDHLLVDYATRHAAGAPAGTSPHPPPTAGVAAGRTDGINHSRPVGSGGAAGADAGGECAAAGTAGAPAATAGARSADGGTAEEGGDGNSDGSSGEAASSGAVRGEEASRNAQQARETDPADRQAIISDILRPYLELPRASRRRGLLHDMITKVKPFRKFPERLRNLSIKPFGRHTLSAILATAGFLIGSAAAVARNKMDAAAAARQRDQELEESSYAWLANRRRSKAATPALLRV